jgi:endonuclease-3 related protein
MEARLTAHESALIDHFASGLDLDHWWPAATRFEVIVGAFLVQNTGWSNVEKAIAELRGAKRLSLAGIRELSEEELGALIRSSGFWRQKARRLLGFVRWLDEVHGGSLDRLFSLPAAQARAQLLALEGIGEETADAILLFAGGHPSFVVDAYTRRIFTRHHLPLDRAGIERALGHDATRFRHLHAVLVETAKRYCRKQAPDCGRCPLGGLLPQ